MQLFLRGIVLPFQKGDAVKRKIEDVRPEQPVRVPVALPEGDIPTLAGADGTPLKKGQVLCREETFSIVSPVAGTLDGTVVLNHPLFGERLYAEIQPDGEAQDRLPVTPAGELTPALIMETAAEAAIYDELDGLPLIEKLRAWQLPAEDPAGKEAVLVADATENDIYGSSAWAVLAEDPKTALFGLQMAAKALHFGRYHIATMLPGKRRRALKRAIGRDHIYIVGDEYPVTVFADGQVEVFRIGIQACLALGRALKDGHRHTDTVLTLAGDGVLTGSRNLRVPFGTDIGALLAAYGVDEENKIVLGDAMTGLTCTDAHTPLLPGVTTILALKPQPVRLPGPCIGCGRCAAVCHAELLPYEIVRRSENMHYERLRHLSPTECDGCAACSYICPANRDVAADVLRAQESDGTLFLSWGDEENE